MSGFYVSAADDIQDTDKLRSLLKDLREARQAKSREGLDQLNRGGTECELSFRFSSLTCLISVIK